MRHCDPELLALRALDEPGDSPDAAAADAHLGECARCQAELDQLRAVVMTARSDDDRTLVPPPPAVWQRIAAELDLTAGTDAPAGTGHLPGTPAAGSAAAASPADATVVPLRRRAQVALVGVAAGLAGLLVGLGVAAVVLDGGDAAPAETVATAALASVADRQGTGTARVEETADGRVLVVDVADLSAGDGYHEVWLLRPDVSGLVSLGILGGERGSFPLPPGLDLAEYPVVDVSLEPYDGDPAHSSDSVVRGIIGG